jgi:hypothetical protein
MAEWIAYDMILTDPLKTPAMTLRMMRLVFDATEIAAILTLLFGFATDAPFSKKKPAVPQISFNL